MIPLDGEDVDSQVSIFRWSHPSGSPSALHAPRRLRRDGAKLDSQRLQIFKQCFLFFGTQLCAELVTATAVAGIPVAAIGRVQRVVKLGLFDREPNFHLV